MQAPQAPDTSRAAYDAQSGSNYSIANKMLGWIFNMRKNQSYERWKLNKENAYNKALQDYETWMQTPEVAGELYDAAGYNRNYAALGSNVGQVGSPGSYTTPEESNRVDPLSLIGSLLSFGSQEVDMVSKGVSTYMNVLQGLDTLKTTRQNRSINGLKNDLTQMTLYKLMTQLFNPQDLELVDSWIKGGVIDVDAKTRGEMAKLGVNDPLYLFLSRGPLRSQTRAETSGLWTALDNAIKTGEKTQAETGLKEKEGEMYNIYKSAGILAPILQALIRGLL